jgi:hypothetical protein
MIARPNRGFLRAGQCSSPTRTGPGKRWLLRHSFGGADAPIDSGGGGGLLPPMRPDRRSEPHV